MSDCVYGERLAGHRVPLKTQRTAQIQIVSDLFWGCGVMRQENNPIKKFWVFDREDHTKRLPDGPDPFG